MAQPTKYNNTFVWRQCFRCLVYADYVCNVIIVDVMLFYSSYIIIISRTQVPDLLMLLEYRTDEPVVMTVGRPSALSCVDGLLVKITHALKVTHASMQHFLETDTIYYTQCNNISIQRCRCKTIQNAIHQGFCFEFPVRVGQI